jgi:hypothetical protein
MDAHKNLAYSTVATAPSPGTSGTSLVVAAGTGSRFPAVPFNATVWPVGEIPLPANAEIVRVTNISTDTLTITREQESTTARDIQVGDQIAATITAKAFTDIEAVAPASGEKDALVGTSGTPGSGNKYVTDADARNTNSRTPTAHASSHQSGGGDAIKLDDLAAPDDNTDLDASTAVHGLLKKLDNDTTHFLRGDGAWASLTPPTQQIFTSDGTWNRPSGCRKVLVEVLGGGGGGGGCAGTAGSQGAAGGGGGGGGYASKLIDVTAISTAAVVVGEGGSGGSAGNNTGSTGETSSWDDGTNTVSAAGGVGGSGSGALSGDRFGGAPGAAGSGSGGTVNADGSLGTWGFVSVSANNAVGGSGGPSRFGGGAKGSSNAAGSASGPYGGGGSGGSINASGASKAGGAGSDGIVIVTEYY